MWLWGAGPFLSLKWADRGIRSPLLDPHLSCGRDVTARGHPRATENISVNSWPLDMKSEAGAGRAVGPGSTRPSPLGSWARLWSRLKSADEISSRGDFHALAGG